MGEAAVLTASIIWAVTSLIAKAQSRQIDAVTMNLGRLATASVCTVSFLTLTGRLDETLHIPLPALGLLLLAVLVSMVIGDTLFYISLATLGAARAMPISGIYPLFSVLLAVPLADEPLRLTVLGGAALVVVGVTLVATGSAERAGDARQAAGLEPPLSAAGLRQGVALCLLAAFAWALGTVLLKLGAVEVDALVANAVRYPSAALVLLVYRVALMPMRSVLPRPSRRVLLMVVLTGILSTTLGGWMYVYGAQTIGAGRTSTLGATSPLWAAPLSAIFLKEPLGWRVVAGTVLCVAGIWLISI